MLNIHNKVHNVCCCCFVAKSHQTLVNPWAVAHQAPLSMEFPKQEYWSGLPFPSPGDLPNTGIEPRYWTHVSCLAGRFFTTGPLGKPKVRNESETRSVMSNSLQPDGLYSPWNSPGQITGVGSLSLLQGIFPTQVSRIQVDSLPAEPQRKPKNTGVGSPSLLQRIFPIQESNLDLLPAL